VGVTETETVDGRRLRREVNREAVLDALGELFAENKLEPSTAEIASRAGISTRSLFRYFDDVDDLHRAAIDRQLALARPLLVLPASPDDAIDVRITKLVEARVQMFEMIEPAARAARVCSHRSPVVDAQLRDGRRHLRKQIETLLGDELSTASLAAADALCSFETHQLLRADQRLSRAATTATLITALTALVQGDKT
jgi:AcrR family transcriptional regulator